MKSTLFLAAACAAMLASCSGNKETVAAAEEQAAEPAVCLTGLWYLDNISANDSTSLRPNEGNPEQARTVAFTDTTYVFTTGCNNFMGDYTLAGDSIVLSEGAATMMLCPDMATEDMLRAVLPGITTVSVLSDSTLRLNGSEPSQFIELRKAE